MMILAVDTATDACSAALWLDGQIIERYRVAPREHNELILPMIQDLLAEAGIGLRQLDALAFGRGPGSFTGVRIATGVVQGIGFAADRPVVAVSTLAALALQAFDECPAADWALPCIDARMSEIYCAIYRPYDDSDPQIIGTEQVLTPEKLESYRLPLGDGVGVGSGWSGYRDVLCAATLGRIRWIATASFPRARYIARLGYSGILLGSAVPAALAQPVYVREQVTQHRPAGRGTPATSRHVEKERP